MRHIKNKYIRFGIVATLYLAWTIWVGSWWLLIGLPVIFDMYISKKVNWTFWKKRGEKNPVYIEWLDAIIFAVLAVSYINVFFFQNYKIPTGSMEGSLLIGDHLYVSKLAYGPKIPNTPLSVPFLNNRMLGSETYLTWLEWDYKRLKGFRSIKRDDPIVFNYPAQDTVIIPYSAGSYYSMVMDQAAALSGGEYPSGNYQKDKALYSKARKNLLRRFEDVTITRPIDKRDSYIKRCVGVPGDTLKIIDGQLYRNGKPQTGIEKIQFKYRVKPTNRFSFNERIMDKYELSNANFPSEAPISDGEGYYEVLLNEKVKNDMVAAGFFEDIQETYEDTSVWDKRVFPFHPSYRWNKDNFGPLYIPQKGATVELNLLTLPLYERIIEAYEKNDLQVKGETIYINGEVATSYTFKMDYYWMMGDNRHNSSDARFWGFVPEDHIVGSPSFVWLSLNKYKGLFDGKIRFDRMFMRIK